MIAPSSRFSPWSAAASSAAAVIAPELEELGGDLVRELGRGDAIGELEVALVDAGAWLRRRSRRCHRMVAPLTRAH